MAILRRKLGQTTIEWIDAAFPPKMTAGPLLTLGEISFSRDDTLQGQHRPLVLLAYLAHNGPQDRRSIATIFWPHAKNPLNSLSSTLTRIRKAVPGLMEVDSHRVAVTCVTDALALLAKLREGDQMGAVAAYGGRFLDGFRLPNLGLELEEWIFETRESIDQAVADAAVACSRSMYEADRLVEAADLAEKAFTIGGMSGAVIDEADLLYAVLRREGRVAAEQLKAAAIEIDLAIDESYVSLPPREVDAAAAPLPGGSPLVGRDHDLDRLATAVRTHGIVNLYGLGGVGKTAVVRGFVQSLSDRAGEFPGGWRRVTVDAEDDGERLLEALASALDVTTARDTLVAALADEIVEPTLLVIDDVQTSPSIKAALTSLADVPNARCVVLSRLPLDLPAVGHVQLHGLSTAVEDGDTVSPAAKLFIEHARPHLTQTAPDLSPATKDLIEQICRRLSGVPLAIELTAAWLRILPLSDVQSMFDDDEILHQVPPGKDLSLGRVIERCWSLLDADTQDALSDLSIMVGGFTRSSARAVASIGVQELASLIDSSLIDVSLHGRMRCHALVQAFAAEQLDRRPERKVELSNRYRSFFVDQLTGVVPMLTGPDQGEALVRLAADHRNFEEVWVGLIAGAEWEAATEVTPALDTYLLRSGQLFAAHRMFAMALTEVSEGQVDSDDGRNRLAALLTNNLAWVQMLLGRETQASELCDQGLAVVPVSDRRTRIALLRTRSALANQAGDCQSSLDGYLEAHELASEIEDETLIALLDEDIGRCFKLLGESEKATAAFRKTLDAARRFGDPHMEARSYLLLGATEVDRDPDQAVVLLDEGEELAERHGLAHLRAYFPRERALAFLALDDPQRAIDEFQRGIALTDEVGDQLALANATIGLGRSYLRLGDGEAAREPLSNGFRLAIRSNSWPFVLGAALTVANFALERDPENELASQLLRFATEHPSTFHDEIAREDFGRRGTAIAPLPADSRLDETCERILRVLRAVIEKR